MSKKDLEEQAKRLAEARRYVNETVMNNNAEIAKGKAIIEKSINAFDKVLKKSNFTQTDVRNFNNVVNNAASQIAHESTYDPAVNEAMRTIEVKHLNIPGVIGAQKDRFAIFPIPNAEGKTRYDVVNVMEQQKVIGDLRLSDAASCIVSLLNKNYSFYSPEVQTVLKLEETYTKHYNDMVVYKRKSKNSQEDLFEIRFEEAKNNALTIKEELFKLNKKLQ